MAQVGAGGAWRCSRCVSAGEYTCCFEAQGFRWELSQVVKVALQATDVTRLPDQLSILSSTCVGFQLTCCIPSTHLTYTASWSPEEGSRGMVGTGGSWLPSSQEAEAAVPPGSLGPSPALHPTGNLILLIQQ